MTSAIGVSGSPTLVPACALPVRTWITLRFRTPNGQFGDDKWSLPGSLMAGADFQIREREIVDLSDRYIDLAQAGSGHRRYERLHINPPFVGRRSDRA
jgi:hypothetical protein